MFLVPPLKFLISIYNFSNKDHEHRLNAELDLQSLFGLHVHSCTHWLRPHNPSAPFPRIWALDLFLQLTWRIRTRDDDGGLIRYLVLIPDGPVIRV